MGCDIHVYFETQADDGQWEQTFPRQPYPKYWWERIIDAYADGGAQITMKEADEEVAFKKLQEYMSSMPPIEVMEKFGEHPMMIWEFMYPGKDRWGSPPITARNYDWFARIAGVRAQGANLALWKLRGWPDDTHYVTKAENDRWEGDGHSHSWQMVREILACGDVLGSFSQYRWLKEHIVDPDRTRMLYFFDN